VNGDHSAGLGVGRQFADDLAHLCVVEHGDADDFGGGDVGHAVGQGGAGFGKWCHGLGADVENRDPARPFDQTLGHRGAHIAEADVAELRVFTHDRMIWPPSTLKIWPVIHFA
jgi:hypothetical protein